MTIRVDNRTCIVFDLDDTLYCEADYLKSAFREIALEIARENEAHVFNTMMQLYYSKGNPFMYLIDNDRSGMLTMDHLLEKYRKHYPSVTLRQNCRHILLEIRRKNGMSGIITDGRSVTQRNKIKALGLEELIDRVLISEEVRYEKPSEIPFRMMMEGREDNVFYYFGDNPAKDFLAGNRLGWITIGVRGCDSVHGNDYNSFPREYQPAYTLSDFSELFII